MKTLYGTAKEDKKLVQALHDVLHTQITCMGQDCR